MTEEEIKAIEHLEFLKDNFNSPNYVWFLKDVDNNYQPCEVQLVQEEEVEFPFELQVMTVEADKNGKISVKAVKKKKYNRAKQKRKTKKMIKRYYGNER